ncbi:MAG: peptidase MA family metallohydrolase [Candidatus Omnitrophica bacterium]|nr:peptidase MA family metallohydrolase [Candidatus Omnitrophota bacterium]
MYTEVVNLANCVARGFAIIFIVFSTMIFLSGARSLSEGEKKLRERIFSLEEESKKSPQDAKLRANLAGEYCDYGLELIRQGDMKEAKVYLERAAELAPQNDYITSNLAAVYFKMGDEALRDKKRIDEAKTAYKLAVFHGGDNDLLKRNVGISLYNKAVGYFEKNDYETAKGLLLDSLNYDSHNEYAFELLGDIAYYNQELGEAEENWKQAFKLARADRIAKKLEKLKRERPVEAKLEDYPSEHFIIRYEGDKKELEGYDIRELLREAYRVISQDLSYYFKRKIAVLLYTEADYNRVTEVPYWSAGLYDGKLRVPAYKRSLREADLTKIIRHELTHAFVFELSAGKAPVWLNEGLAEFEANKVSPVDTSFFNKALKNDVLLVFEEFFKDPKELKDPASISLFYQQSFMLTSYLIERYRMYKVKELLQELAKGTRFDEAFDKVLHISYEKLEKDWLESLKGYGEKKAA